jgi:hypothetical protein
MSMTNQSPAGPVAAGAIGAPPTVELRPMQPHDGEAVAETMYSAFAEIHDRDRFPRDFPTLESAASSRATSSDTPRSGAWWR